MNPHSFRIETLVVFFISLLSLCLELFFTRILSLKTYTHVVYVVIPFAMLGYGIGTNLYLLIQEKIRLVSRERVLGITLLGLALVTLLSTIVLIHIPLTVDHLTKVFVDLRSAFVLSLAYLNVALPFILMGFLLMFIFCDNPQASHRLYFWDLVGAGLGAVAFYFLIQHLGVFRSLTFLSLTAGSVALSILLKKRFVIILFLIFSFWGCLKFLPEITRYPSDYKGWENFPRAFSVSSYETLTSQWHPLGRTDSYRLKTPSLQAELFNQAIGTFEINVLPTPDFVYLVTNFFAGTPVYKLSKQGLEEQNASLKIFSQAMEFPYLLTHEPKVLVIGAGGGRDIFMAKTHGAEEVLAAEINSSIVQSLSKGGNLYDYSGRVYDEPGVKVLNVDGRHLVKRLPDNSFDLMVLNGVDTFSGLSSGAYTFAESYLYTKNAIQDYLRVLKPDGLLNLNRWIFLEAPRETLRLFAIVLESLSSMGVENPCGCVLIAAHEGWGMMLIKKTPFEPKEVALLKKYFEEHNALFVYPSQALRERTTESLNFFDHYAIATMSKDTKEFITRYPYDISVITDDNPFFYKYYRFKDFHPKEIFKYSNHPGAGMVVFLTQVLVLIHAVLFILFFICFPLLVMRHKDLKSLGAAGIFSFVSYFALLGVGFMFLEITLMQKFVLLLGNPIYSLAITLPVLLISSGIGSWLWGYWQKKLKNGSQGLSLATVVLVILIGFLIQGSGLLLNLGVGFPLLARIILVCIIVLPLGLCLGVFFPAGLELVSQHRKEAMAWAWGINFGFSVLGSMLAIIVAQLKGFNLVLLLAGFCYILAFLFFDRLRKRLCI